MLASVAGVNVLLTTLIERLLVTCNLLKYLLILILDLGILIQHQFLLL